MYQSDKISDYYKITHDGNALHFKQSHGPDLEETDFYTPIISENNKRIKLSMTKSLIKLIKIKFQSNIINYITFFVQVI